MAKASLAGTIDAISGHTGTLNFQIGPAGFVVNSRPAAATKPTPRQTAERRAWTNMVTAWAKSTTPTQRAGWKALADANPTPTKCGGSAAPTGFQQFMAVNRHLQKAGVAIKLDPPGTTATPSQGDVTGAYATGPPATLTLTPTNNPTATQTPITWASGPTSPGTQATTTHTKIMKVFAPGTAGPFDIATQWQNNFGPLRAGLAITVSLQYVDYTTGAQSAKTHAKVIT
jgi:hypothetical protein